MLQRFAAQPLHHPAALFERSKGCAAESSSSRLAGQEEEDSAAWLKGPEIGAAAGCCGKLRAHRCIIQQPSLSGPKAVPENLLSGAEPPSITTKKILRRALWGLKWWSLLAAVANCGLLEASRVQSVRVHRSTSGIAPWPSLPKNEASLGGPHVLLGGSLTEPPKKRSQLVAVC